jgi:hypothetical protein
MINLWFLMRRPWAAIAASWSMLQPTRIRVMLMTLVR